jgi:hypothetical protein
MATPMSTPIQNLPVATVNVSKEEDSVLKDVLKEVEREIASPQLPQGPPQPAPIAPRIPPNAPTQPYANNAPLIYAMPTPTTPPASVLKLGPLTLKIQLVKYVLVASIVALVLYSPVSMQKLYQLFPMLSRFQTYEWALRFFVMAVVTYLIYIYVL